MKDLYGIAPILFATSKNCDTTFIDTIMLKKLGIRRELEGLDVKGKKGGGSGKEERREEEEGGGRYMTASEQSFLLFMTLMLDPEITAFLFFPFFLHLIWTNTCMADKGGSGPTTLI